MIVTLLCRVGDNAVGRCGVHQHYKAGVCGEFKRDLYNIVSKLLYTVHRLQIGSFELLEDNYLTAIFGEDSIAVGFILVGQSTCIVSLCIILDNF